MGADKGRAVVIMDKTEYDQKLQAMLDDEKTYQKLDKDPTLKHKRKLIGMLTKLKKDNKIDEAQYKQLYPTTEYVPRVYATPKIHKPNVPLRPIVDYTGSIGYATSRALSDILSPLVGNTPRHVKNSQDLAEEMTEILIEEDENFLSHDVISLFTNVPIQKALEIIRQRLTDDDTLKSRTNLTVDDIVELTEFILTTTYFTSRGQLYCQKFGTAMGSPVSPLIANIVMEHLEDKAIATAPLDCKPRLFKRYVDDILEIVRKNTEDKLTDHLNSIDDTGSLKFTYEKEQDGKIAFLDTLIVRKPDGSVKLLVYRKPTHTNQYLNFNSAHPLHQKLGVIRTLLDRKDKIVTEPADKIAEEEIIKSALQQCGYPQWSIDKVNKARQQPKTKNSKKNKNEVKTLTNVTLPYIAGVTEKIQRIFRKHNIGSAVKPHSNLRNMLVHVKDKQDNEDKAGVVYEIPCKNCDKTYIGETGRRFGTRKKEHKTETDKVTGRKFTRTARIDSQNSESKSSIADHAATENHVINWDNTNILARDDVRNTRWIRESIWIRRKANGEDMKRHLMNGDEGAYQLSHLYDQLIQKTSSTSRDVTRKSTASGNTGSTVIHH